MFPQKSMDEFIMEGEILEARIKFLKNEKSPLKYLGLDGNKMSNQFIVDNYYKYLDEAGLSFNKYKFTMHPSFKSYQPGDFAKGLVTWDEDYIRSMKNFFPYIESSSWVRKRLVKAFTSSKYLKNRKKLDPVFSEMIDAMKENDTAASISFYREIFEDPAWKGTKEEKQFADLFARWRLQNGIPESGNCLSTQEVLEKITP